MKKKNHSHPKYYLDIITKKGNVLLLSFISNHFSNDGTRIIQYEEISISRNLQQNKDIINQLNQHELLSLNKYIGVQDKVLLHHKNKNNVESLKVVKESIVVMKKFKEYY